MFYGPIPQALKYVIDIYTLICGGGLKVIYLSQNQGLGLALQMAVESASHELVARMDSDDLAAPDRFEKQVGFMLLHPEVDLCGGQMTEFVGDSANIVGVRNCPIDDAAIKNYMKSRCALNHVTVIFKKSAVLRAGNYQPWHYNEDYYLC